MIDDVLVVGGGPAGLAAAIRARMAGLSACVLERRGAPFDKACGEGLMPAGVVALAEMGVDLAPRDYAPLAGVRFVDGSCAAEAAFARGSGRGVRRTTLIAALRRRAGELGVTLACADVTAVRQSASSVAVESSPGPPRFARHVLAADGLHSPLRARLGLSLPARAATRFGVRRHFAIAPWSGLVEVHFADCAEAYVTPVGRGEIGVALLWSGGKRRWDELLRGFPALEARLAGARAASSARGAGPFAQRVARRHAGRVALIGDAAGYLDPLSGEGVTLAFRTARAAIDVIASGRPLSGYEAEYRAASRPYYVMTRLLLALAARPRLRARVIRALAEHPAAFAKLLAITGGDAPLADLAGAALSLAWPLSAIRPPSRARPFAR